MSFEWRMARREMRAGFRKFLFAILAVAAGVGALTGVKGFGLALQSSLSRQSRQLIAADLVVRMSSLPSPQEAQFVDEMVARGATIAHTTETISMVSSGDAPPVLTSIKAIDRELYPLYGAVKLDTGGTLKTLEDSQVVATPDLLLRLDLQRGSFVQVGSATYQIAAVLESEPDRLASGFQLGPRVLLTRRALERSQLIRLGSRAAQIYHVRLPAQGLTLQQARGIAESRLAKRARLLDYRDPSPRLSRGLERTETFLSLVGLIALLVGSLGVAMTLHAYLQQRLDTIAILKSLGARSAQIMRVYLLQGMSIGLAGSLLGVAAGYAVQLLFPRFLAGLLEIETHVEAAPWAVVQGLAVGVLVTTLLLLVPLLRIRRIRPAMVFRRHMSEQEAGPNERRLLQRLIGGVRRVRQNTLSWVTAALIFASIGGIAAWMAGSWRRGYGFVGALLGATLVLMLLARLLLLALRRLPRLRNVWMRHGLANLHRPGNQTVFVLATLGIGVALTSSIYLVQSSLLGQIQRTIPADFPNLFVLGISSDEKDRLWSYLASHATVIDAGKPVAATPARVTAVDGRSVEKLGGDDRGDRQFAQMEFTLSWSEQAPPDTRILEGKWWTGTPSEPQVSAGKAVANVLGLHLGSRIEFNAGGRALAGRVANIRESDSLRPGSNNQFIFSPGALEGMPTTYVGNLRVRPEGVRILQRDLFRQFPTLTTVNLEEVLGTVQKFIEKIALVIQFISAFAILAGIIVLASTIASTRYRRVREAALMKALG
ncbi:MAG: ABC transporter permease, partial [Acidobacteriota bacterium]